MTGAGKDLRALVRDLVAEDWRCREGNGGHIILYPPGGGRPVVVSRSPRSPAALTAARADVRRSRRR